MLKSSPVRSLHHSDPSVLDLGVWMCCGDFSAGVVVLASIGELNAPFGSRLTLWLVGLTAIQKRCHWCSSKQAQVPVPWPESNCASRAGR